MSETPSAREVYSAAVIVSSYYPGIRSNYSARRVTEWILPRNERTKVARYYVGTAGEVSLDREPSYIYSRSGVPRRVIKWY